jgi:hypothetical protein
MIYSSITHFLPQRETFLEGRGGPASGTFCRFGGENLSNKGKIWYDSKKAKRRGATK